MKLAAKPNFPYMSSEGARWVVSNMSKLLRSRSPDTALVVREGANMANRPSWTQKSASIKYFPASGNLSNCLLPSKAASEDMEATRATMTTQAIRA